MNFAENSGVSIQRAFNTFHESNPQVFKLFEEMVEYAVTEKKKTKLSAKMIINAIRWNVFLETKDSVEFTERNGEKHPFRINDAYTSRYARLYIEKHPDRSEIFNLKELRA